MSKIAGGVVFEEVGEEVKAGFRGREGVFGGKVRAVRQCETLDAFDDVGAAGKAALGEARRQQPVLRRFAGMERLAHRAELRFEPSRLRACDTQCDRSRLAIETEEPTTGRRRPKASDGTGRMKAEIV